MQLDVRPGTRIEYRQSWRAYDCERRRESQISTSRNLRKLTHEHTTRTGDDTNTQRFRNGGLAKARYAQLHGKERRGSNDDQLKVESPFVRGK